MAKPKVFLCARLPVAAEEFLADRARLEIHRGKGYISRRALMLAVRTAEGLIPTVANLVDSELMDAAPRLRVIANYGVGYDNIDTDAAAARGLPVTNTPGVLTETTADLAWTLVMASARRVGEGDRLVRSGRWEGWQPTQMLGQDIHGRTLGILGMGRIGAAMARRARGFGMKILYHDIKRLSVRAERVAGMRYASLQGLLKRSDFVSVHTPLTGNTHHLIGAGELRLMKPTAILVNTSRGPVVDEKALAAALKGGRIAAAGLDVFEREPAVEPALRKLENVVLLPHLGSASVETRTAMGLLAAKNCLAALAGRKPPNLVNSETWRGRRK
jgi:glyoxylate reductase